MQSLIDEGRITDEEARTHPHRHLILKAIDGVHDIDADLFDVELQHGDRLLFCSDGASGVLDDGRLADVLSMGTPDYAAVELVRASLEAGTNDNVTCIVADVVDEYELPDEQQPMLVGAAADLKRRLARADVPHLFRGHRAGDTGELEPIRAEIPDDVRVRDRDRPGRPRGGAVRAPAAAPLPVRASAARRASRCSAWSGSSAPRRTPGASSSTTSATTSGTRDHLPGRRRRRPRRRPVATLRDHQRHARPALRVRRLDRPRRHRRRQPRRRPRPPSAARRQPDHRRRNRDARPTRPPPRPATPPPRRRHTAPRRTTDALGSHLLATAG